jgi:rsbT co-antagonist protein RsbR
MSSYDKWDKPDNHHFRLASVGQIAAGIAHEIRNPLTAVKGFLQLLQQKSPHEYIDIAQQELDHAITTLQDLLNISKPDAEDEPSTRVNLCAELETILNLFQDQSYRVTVDRIFEDGEVEIVGKKNQLKRAFFNILKNAFEAIPEQGTIRIHHYCKDQNVFVVISDTGSGIPPHQLAMLGTPFFTTKTEGTGMGLAYVYSIIYQHGGTIGVESTVGQGTTFTLQFPLHQESGKGGVAMDFQFAEGMSLEQFLEANKEQFELSLSREAVNVKDIFHDVKETGCIDLINNAHQLIKLMIHRKELDIVNFARQEGVRWAKHASLNLAVKLEWSQAIRRVWWDFMYNYAELSGNEHTLEQFFALERQVNTALDTFLRHFFISYIQYKDELIKNHEEMIKHLSVPMIPLTSSIYILPLLGKIDEHRIRQMQEKVLNQIGLLHIRTLLIDMSNAAVFDSPVLTRMLKMIDGIGMMGCNAIITGMRPDLVVALLDIEASLRSGIKTKGSLQQALEELGIRMPSE